MVYLLPMAGLSPLAGSSVRSSGLTSSPEEWSDRLSTRINVYFSIWFVLKRQKIYIS